MRTLQQSVQFLLVYKDLVGLVIQVGLLLATFALISVVGKQAKAAAAQANAAIKQVRAADAQAEAAYNHAELAKKQLQVAERQLETAKSKFEEQVYEGITSSRPNFKFRDADPGFKTSPVMIKNLGPGIAYRVNWRFLAAGDSNLQNQVYELGSLAVGQEVAIPWGFNKEFPRLQTRMLDENGIRVECMDAAGRLYSTVAKMNQHSDFVTDTERVLPNGATGLE